MSDVIIYEQPLNEIIRTCLRLEHVFLNSDYFISKSNEWNYRASMRSLTEAMAILDRPDFKGKIKQELIRYKSSLHSLQDHKDVDSSKLQKFINDIEISIKYLDNHSGKLGDNLRENDFLTNIRHNLQKAGGSCDFESPNYHYWLSHPKVEQHENLEKWFAQLSPVKDLIYLMLRSIRDSTHFETVTANSGSYQQALESNQPYQLLRVAIKESVIAFPEMSVGRQRFSICFRSPSTTEHTEQLKTDIKFSIACCKL